MARRSRLERGLARMGEAIGRPRLLAAAAGALLALACVADPVASQWPGVMGVEHTPLVVANLEKAEADFRAMGFAIKPGRFHADGIRNAHVKFANGTELELITAPAPVDALTSEYYAHEQRGDGPVYFGLTAANHPELLKRIRAMGLPVQQDGGALTFPQGHPLHPLFLGSGDTSPTDRAEYFAHANSALRLSGFWVRGNPQERDFLERLGVRFHRMKACGPLGTANVGHMPNGDVLLVDAGPQDGSEIGARIEVRSLDVAAAVMTKNGFMPKRYSGCGLWLPPKVSHGIWLQFVEPAGS